ncbi:MAG: DNA/RNA nuclease SfsA [Aestuariivita sp.]|nr:DNA/RNA nuclease SfsA [Aestuariivita sp.]
MQFQTPLIPANLKKRYKRFLADCILDNGQQITAHCPNPGSMIGLAEPNTRIWLEPNYNPKKKLKFGWRLVEHLNGHFTGVDTTIPNRILRHALEAHSIPQLNQYDSVQPEIKVNKGSRIDFLLTAKKQPNTYIEVKSVTLMRQKGMAEFPDAVTERGTRHLQELERISNQGHRAILFFLVQRTDCRHLTIADDIDQIYAHTLKQAQTAGVEILAYGSQINSKEITLGTKIDFIN